MRSRGEIIVLRNIWHGRVRNATPLVVVEDGPERTVLWHPEGTREQAPEVGGVPRAWQLREHTGDEEVVVVYTHGDRHSVHVGRRAGQHYVWYVNFETPWQRTALGYDTRDLLLDIWVDPDRSWRYLDEDELEEAHAEGLLTDTEIVEIRVEGERVARMIQAWQAPFSDDWENWKPDPSWPLPVLPPDWDA
jgi:hypothetical protein